MAKTVKLSKSQARHQKYVQLSREGADKNSRNSAIEQALGEGEKNVSARATFTKAKKKMADGSTMMVDVINIPKEIVEAKFPTLGVPTDGSRAAKRARLKASRHKQLNPAAKFAHKTGRVRCGNVGCRRCFPELNRPRPSVRT